VSRVLRHIKHVVSFCSHLLQQRFLRWTQPPPTSLLLGTIRDLAWGKAGLVAENALLCQQLIILRRQIKRPTYTKTDRMLLVLLARATRMWRQALLIVQPETLLKWHRQGFRLFWKQKSKAKSTQAKLAAETIALIKEMARNNRRLRSRTYSGRIAQAGYSRLQTNHPEVHAAQAHSSIKGTELENLPTQSCGRHLGL
jgi:putative transposase